MRMWLSKFSKREEDWPASVMSFRPYLVSHLKKKKKRGEGSYSQKRPRVKKSLGFLFPQWRTYEQNQMGKNNSSLFKHWKNQWAKHKKIIFFMDISQGFLFGKKVKFGEKRFWKKPDQLISWQDQFVNTWRTRKSLASDHVKKFLNARGPLHLQHFQV